MPERVPLILDVDTGIDDSLALLYAAASPEADLLAVTCVSGNTDARSVARNTRAVLELAGRADVEVALGREVPLVRPLETTPETHGPQGLGYAQCGRRVIHTLGADTFAFEQFQQSPAGVDVVVHDQDHLPPL